MSDKPHPSFYAEPPVVSDEEAEEAMADIRKWIAGLPVEVQTKVEARAMTLRNIVRADIEARMAFALVGAELAAQPLDSPERGALGTGKPS